MIRGSSQGEERPSVPDYAADVLAHFRGIWGQKERILIVCDGTIEPRKSGYGFFLSEVIRSVEGSHWFEFVVGTRNGDFEELSSPNPNEPDYGGFRFDNPTISARMSGYGQIWLFGDNVSGESWNPLTDSELAILVGWMNNGGGLFAAGDHQELGAAIASRVPRVNSMRRWLSGDGVPDQDGPRRFETTRPATPEQANGLVTIYDYNEDDLMPQRIEWVPEYVGPALKTPHPLLCHPTLGPIDVLPDHMHEGWCHDPGTPKWRESFAESTYAFGAVSGDTYPAGRNTRTLPRVVAWGQTLASPPLSFGTGPQPWRRVPLIVAYDGQTAGVGRVVVDSTWHHWFDYNLTAFAEVPAHEASRKIYRYWLNVALWLSRSTKRAAVVLDHLKYNEFSVFGRQIVDLSSPTVTIGRATIAWLGQRLSPCIVRSFADELATEILEDCVPPKDDGLRSPCEPPLERVQAMIMGEIIRDLYADQKQVMQEIAKHGRAKPPVGVGEAMDIGRRAARRALAALADEWARELAEGKARHARFSARIASLT